MEVPTTVEEIKKRVEDIKNSKIKKAEAADSIHKELGIRSL